VAVGFTNVLGPFLGGYPATGSFSRTAIKSKAGVRTPLAGIFTAVIVLLALYALTSVFFYIPSASLSGLIIHAVLDLITPPDTVYQFWKTSPIDVVVFFAGVFVSIFTTIENGIYVTMALSGAILLFRIAKSRGQVLGHVELSVKSGKDGEKEIQARQVFLPYDKRDGANPRVHIESPYPGVFVYRFPDGFNYANAALHIDTITIHVFKETRRTQLDKFAKIGVS
jgi:solute carrier family 26 (sodium-independent sulfate anion transporter), member 11